MFCRLVRLSFAKPNGTIELVGRSFGHLRCDFGAGFDRSLNRLSMTLENIGSFAQGLLLEVRSGLTRAQCLFGGVVRASSCLLDRCFGGLLRLAVRIFHFF